MEKVQLSVSECIALINQTLEYAYPSVRVIGEVSSFKISQSKYVFFDIKDAQSNLGCFMSVWQLRMPLEDGMKIEIVARPSITKWGKFSLSVLEIKPVGEGSIKRSFDLLVTKLKEEGLFDEDRKRTLPEVPSYVGVISSTQAAGYNDFIKIVNDRFGGVKIDVAHVQVQGSAAPAQIISALSYFNELSSLPEVLVIVRGGGSMDDLAAFNDELLARAIAGSRIPVLVGIGHEDDITIADMVADVRASTPSNAAQLLVPDKAHIISTIMHNHERMLQRVDASIIECRSEIEEICRNMLLSLSHRHDRVVADLSLYSRMMKQLNPKLPLNRGYSITRNSKGKIIRSVADVSAGEELQIEVAQAILKAGVTYARKKN